MFDDRYLVDYTSDAAFSIDGNSKIVAWNYRESRLLGKNRRELADEV